MSLRDEIQQAINMASAENGSNTPDFILAEYLTDCLGAFDKAVTARSKWYGRHDVPGQSQKVREYDDESEEPQPFEKE